MPTIETVRGPIAAETLGRTLMHEHVFVLDPEALQNFRHAWGAPYWEEEERVAAAVADLRRAHAAGIGAIVDPTAPGLGRWIPRLQRVAAMVDLHIVVASGYYAFMELPGFLVLRTDDAITELFVRELRHGIDDTGVKAAFLKCAVDRHGLIGDVPRILRTVAAASVETTAPVMVHTNSAARTGQVALDALTAEGVDPRHIVIAHAGDSNDLEYLRALLERGASLGFDRFGLERFNPDTSRVETLVRLLELGYASQIHLAHDGACFYDFTAYNPELGHQDSDLLHIEERILPRLRERGVTDDQIDQMLVDNPARFLGRDT